MRFDSMDDLRAFVKKQRADVGDYYRSLEPKLPDPQVPGVPADAPEETKDKAAKAHAENILAKPVSAVTAEDADFLRQGIRAALQQLEEE